MSPGIGEKGAVGRLYAKVIVDITLEKLDRVFEYHVPDELTGLMIEGAEVVVPFGRGDRKVPGYVVGVSDDCDYDPSKIKDIISVSENSVRIEGKMARLAAWMRRSYGGTMIQALKTVLPVKKKENAKTLKFVRLAVPRETAEEKLSVYEAKSHKARARVLTALLYDSPLEYGFVIKKLSVSRATLLAMQDQGVIAIDSERVYRDPLPAATRAASRVDYNAEQRRAIDAFREDYDRGIRKTYLLHGVTGSGKTEVYMEMISCALRHGKQAIVLIPEIALTYQTVMRFYGRFQGRVSILNSGMSNGERYDQMVRAKSGEVDVMIGPRSALFTPFPDLGLIVIDEEHETTYKNDRVPRYHARETAIERARLEGASVVLGSATPSLEAFYRAKKGEYELLTLKERSQSQPLPTVNVADMRDELRQGNRTVISAKLRELILDRLAKKQQIMLFINRRGYAGFISCRDCGQSVKCPHCDVTLTLHGDGKLICHYCGYTTMLVKRCPSCGSEHIGAFRVGTQKVEEYLGREFPSARIIRMDADSVAGKDGYGRILEKFSNGDADIMIGTQMIVKGHDFPNVTLVGILAADLSLNVSDYRAAERTFQLLTQAAGRAGRGREKGEVVIQTYSPEHYSVKAAAMQDYGAFYREEIAYRKLMGYPPASHMLAILTSCGDEALLYAACAHMKNYALRVNRDGADILGPASPAVSKINDVYRRVIYVKHERYGCLIRLKDELERYIRINDGFRKVTVQFDFDPVRGF